MNEGAQNNDNNDDNNNDDNRAASGTVVKHAGCKSKGQRFDTQCCDEPTLSPSEILFTCISLSYWRPTFNSEVPLALRADYLLA